MGSIVLFDSVKGGVGKSTLIAQFVVGLAERANVALMDCDPQGSVQKWVVRRYSGSQYQVNFDVLEADLAFLRDNKQNYDFIIVDSAGADTETGRELILLADIVISPLQPTTAALDTIPAHSLITAEAFNFNPKMKLFYLLNMCDTHSKDTEAAETLDSLIDFLKGNSIATVIQQFIYNRKLLKKSYSNGGTCFDSRKNKSKDEILDVMKVIFSEVFNG